MLLMMAEGMHLLTKNCCKLCNNDNRVITKLKLGLILNITVKSVSNPCNPNNWL